MGSVLWISLCCILACELIQLKVRANPVTVTCESCDNKGSQLKGTIGGNVRIKYMVNSQNFRLLSIIYNETNFIEVAPHIVNSREVKDPRFSIPNKPTVKGNNTSLIITLSELSQNDNGADFKYKYKDDKLAGTSGTNILTVEAASAKSKVEVKDDSHLIVIGVVIGVLIIIMIVIGFLLYKGILSLAWCLEICSSKKSNDHVPFPYGEHEEKVYDTPHNQFGVSNSPGQREYAALGPGGDQKDKIKSGYAQVKRDDGKYSSDFEEPDSIIV